MIKIAEITKILVSEVTKSCRCDNFVISNKSATLNCYEDKTAVTYRGSISDDKLLENLAAWIKNTDEISVLNTTLKLNADCIVKIERMDDKSCDESTGKQAGINSAAVAVPLVLIIIAVGILVLVIVFFFLKTRRGKSYSIFG